MAEQTRAFIHPWGGSVFNNRPSHPDWFHATEQLVAALEVSVGVNVDR